MWEGVSSSAMDFQNSHETIWCGFGNPWPRVLVEPGASDFCCVAARAYTPLRTKWRRVVASDQSIGISSQAKGRYAGATALGALEPRLAELASARAETSCRRQRRVTRKDSVLGMAAAAAKAKPVRAKAVKKK
jgi:hypothetical protein